MKIAHDRERGLSRILHRASQCQGRLGILLSGNQQFCRRLGQLFGKGEGGTFCYAVAAGAFEGDVRAVAESWLITGQLFTAEVHQGQRELCSEFDQARFITFQIDAGQALIW